MFTIVDDDSISINVEAFLLSNTPRNSEKVAKQSRIFVLGLAYLLNGLEGNDENMGGSLRVCIPKSDAL